MPTPRKPRRKAPRKRQAVRKPKPYPAPPADPLKDWGAGEKLFDHILTVDIFNGAQVAVFEDGQRLERWFDERGLKLKKKAVNGSAFTVTDPDGRDWFLLYLPKRCSVETAAHECLHTAWGILDSYGVKVDADNHEALAYLMQHLFRQVSNWRRGKR